MEILTASHRFANLFLVGVTSGIGIPPQHLDVVFQIFSNVLHTQDQYGGGTGVA